MNTTKKHVLEFIENKVKTNTVGTTIVAIMNEFNMSKPEAIDILTELRKEGKIKAMLGLNNNIITVKWK